MQEWEVVSDEQVGDFEVFSVRRQSSRSPRDGRVYPFHVVDPADSVVVVPVTGDGRIVMVEQFRHGVRELVLEFPAGTLEAGEDEVTAGLRELREETGYGATGAEVVGRFNTDPALQNTVVTVVFARGCDCEGDKDEDQSEDVGVRLLEAQEIDALIDAGTLRSAPALAAWTLYRRRADGRA